MIQYASSQSRESRRCGDSKEDDCGRKSLRLCATVQKARGGGREVANATMARQ